MSVMPVRHPQMYGSRWDAKVMRELAKKLAMLFSIIYQQSWLTGEVSADWKLASVANEGSEG